MSEDDTLGAKIRAARPQWVEVGRYAERSIIVSWLLGHGGDQARVFANAIEAGDHIRELELPLSSIGEHEKR